MATIDKEGATNAEVTRAVGRYGAGVERDEEVESVREVKGRFVVGVNESNIGLADDFGDACGIFEETRGARVAVDVRRRGDGERRRDVDVRAGVEDGAGAGVVCDCGEEARSVARRAVLLGPKARCDGAGRPGLALAAARGFRGRGGGWRGGGWRGWG